MLNRVLILLILGSFCLAPMLFSGTRGKISGRVTDAGSGAPLIGANVLVKDTPYGASTDLDGYYVITNMPPGTYTIQGMYIGYNTMEVTGVEVNIDLTAKVDISLSEEALDATETITVVAERKAIQRDLTATTAIVGDEEIEALPITEVSEVLSLQAGFVDGHMRGGRSGEVAYWIDGIPVTDAYDGTSVVDVNKDVVQELQVISGAFNAEYGNAMSGIVNIVTKDGSNDFGGQVNAYFGDYISSNDDIFWNVSNVNPLNIYNIDASIHGAIIKDKIFYYLNGRHIYFGGWLSGQRVYNPQNLAFVDENGEFIPNIWEEGKGDGEFVPMNWNRKNYGQAKFVFRLTPTISVLSTTIFDHVNYQDYDRAYKLNPDGNLQRKRQGATQLVKLTHVLSPSTFYDFGVSYFLKNYNESVYEDQHDPRYVHPMLGQTYPFSFKTGGVNDHYFERETRTLLAKFDFTSQISRRHEFKTGLEAKKHEMDFADITLRPDVNQDFFSNPNFPYIKTVIPADCTTFASHYTRKPVEASFYVQDKMEFEDFIINVGVRFDYFDSDGYVLSDPTDPEIYHPIKPDNLAASLDERREYWYKKAEPKFQFSPRIGAAFPVSATGKVYFSYGYFFQRPRFELLYLNPDFEMPVSGAGVVGNADLRPEKTIQGEIGLQQQISEDLSIDATVYFRDIRDLTGTRSDRISIFGSGRTYSRYVNSDFGLVKGFILALNKRLSGGFSARVDYTFQEAKGTASDPQDAHKAVEGGNLPEVQMVPLAWDQRHTINFTATYAAASWGASIVGRYGSGLPYTPRSFTDISSIQTNGALKPPTNNMDLRAYKTFIIGKFDLTAFIRIFNLFDTLNETNVYDDSGRADETIDELNARMSLGEGGEWVNSLDDWFTNATHYSEPRRVEMGITFKF